MNYISATLPAGLALLALIAPGAPAGDATDSKSFVYQKTKQGDLSMEVHFPPGWKKEDKRPAIVFFFGGGWTNGTPKQFEPQARYLAGRGMVAVRADYRVKSRHKVTPVECVLDARAAIRWVRKNAATLGVDADKIVAAGGSAGGHIAACTALGAPLPGEDTAVSCKPSALVLFNPVLRFEGLPDLVKRLGDNAKLAHALSPTLFLSKQSPPTILFYGNQDRLLAQGEEFLAQAKKHGARGEVFLADGVGHGFFNRSPWQEKTLRRADEFLASLGYLQGPPTIKDAR